MPASGPNASAHPDGRALCLAGLKVVLDGPLCPPFSAWPAAYQPFLCAAAVAAAEAQFREGVPARRPRDAGFSPTYMAGSWQAGREAGREVYRFHAGENRAYLWAEPEAEFRTVAIWSEPESGRKMPPLLHPVDRVLSMGLLAHRGGFIVHACGWSANGKSVLFPGVSGAGKTTLCRQLMAAGRGGILSDDRVILRAGVKGFDAWGTPWPGDAKQARNESAPLAAVCFIEKSPDHRLTPIPPAEALRRLMEAASVPWFSPDLRDRVLPLAARLVETVPAFRLGFRPDPGVVACLWPLVESAG